MKISAHFQQVYRSEIEKPEFEKAVFYAMGWIESKMEAREFQDHFSGLEGPAYKEAAYTFFAEGIQTLTSLIMAIEMNFPHQTEAFEEAAALVAIETLFGV